MDKPPAATAKTPTSNRFRLKVYSQFRVYYEDDVSSISAVNDTGPFDVLAQHHNFITLLNPCNLDIKTEGKPDFVITITRGIMQVKPGNVVVFLDV